MIDMIVLDVDGCLTDGKIIYTQEHYETKAFNVKDGLAIKSWMSLGHHVVIITGRNSEVVSRRARELGITEYHQGIKDKLSLLEEILEKYGLSFVNIAAIGDDLNDYKMLSKVNKPFTPLDGAKHILEISTVLTRKGGDAAVREMIEALITYNKEENKFLALWQ